MSNLAGKVAVVSGAAQGLGEAFARALSEQGASVLAFDVLASITDVAATIEQDTGNPVCGLVASVAERYGVEQVVAAALERFGGIDIVVNNAGAWKYTPLTSNWEQTVADWDEIMDTNIKGVLLLSRACVPHMRVRGGGDIVNISTFYVLPAKSEGSNGPETDLYNASKWALNGFTDKWSKYLAKDNIRVNSMCMEGTDTPMLRNALPEGEELPQEFAAILLQPQQIAQQMLELIADGRSGENIGAWCSEPVLLPPRAAAHRRITG